MKIITISTIIFLTVALLSLNSKGQERIIHGSITTFDSIPLINAQIKVKSSKQVVSSDTLGRFSVECSQNDILIVTAEGFYNQKVKLEPNTKLALVNLKLKPGEKNRELAIGYGHVTDRDKLNSIANMNSGDFDFSQYSNMYDLIRGRLPGVQIVGNEIIIRGINSITSSNSALIVVDGIAMQNSILSTLSPSQIKSISVIKDASSAIYGARGANGVVLIETKDGKDN
ncbi:MAG: TonB-dependent receptor plug domain-containing protein [Draconibacterium sp.]